MIVKLYTTLGCHLCEQALALLTELPIDLDIREIEISADEQLLDTYGLRIPVVAITGRNSELDWPFDVAQLAEFIAGR